MKELIKVFLLCYVAQTVWGSTRHDRFWPISRSDSVDFPQSSPFGSRYQVSRSRYDFHRGVDIRIPDFTPLYAIDDGIVTIAGSHRNYRDGVVQLEHEGWEEAPCYKFYTNYIHVFNSTVQLNQEVRKGDLVAYSWHTSNGYEHLHFEIRANGRFQRHCCNPWKYLPNANNDYSSFTAYATLTPNLNGENCQAVVNVSVPPDQLTFNRVELHIHNGQSTTTRVFDMCEDNLTHSFAEMDNPNFENHLTITANRFTSRSLERMEWAGYGFEFYDLPTSSAGTVTAKVFDVFGNYVTTSQASYACN